MDYPKSVMYCLVSLDEHKYDPSGKQTSFSASQASRCQQVCCCLLIAASKESEGKSRPGRSAQAALDAEEGGEEGGLGGEEWEEKI